MSADAGTMRDENAPPTCHPAYGFMCIGSVELEESIVL